MPPTLHPTLHARLAERLAFILARLRPPLDPQIFLADPDVHADALRDPEIARALGWIEGLADAEDVTVLELLDLSEIPLKPPRPLDR